MFQSQHELIGVTLILQDWIQDKKGNHLSWIDVLKPETSDLLKLLLWLLPDSVLCNVSKRIKCNWRTQGLMAGRHSWPWETMPVLSNEWLPKFMGLQGGKGKAISVLLCPFIQQLQGSHSTDLSRSARPVHTLPEKQALPGEGSALTHFMSIKRLSTKMTTVTFC